MTKSKNDLLDAAKQIERDMRHVQIKLPWGQVEWRESTTTISGRAKDGTPFTIPSVRRLPLLRWLKGASLKLAFPTMDPSDRALLTSGRCTDDETILQTDLPHLNPHPGAQVVESMQHYNMSPAIFAAQTGIPIKKIKAICAGKAPITAEIAPHLERHFRRPARLWLEMQRRHDEAHAR